ncbi:MAG: hydroxyacid dehydrogenase [bacterium]|jgi:D-3-phosphoglycerate dehydrogenase
MSRILVAELIHDAGIKLIADLGHEAVLLDKYPDPDAVMELSKKVEGLIVRTMPIPRDLIDNAPNLRVIGKHGVGIDNIDISAATEKGIQVVYTPGASSQAVAEHAVMLMLSVAKKVVTFDRELRSGNFWVRNEHRTVELSGKTVGLVGRGRIASLVGQMCYFGFNMKVLVYHPRSDDDSMVKPWGQLTNNLYEMLPQCDFVSLHCPLNKETTDLINDAALECMKKTAILINTARGPIVNSEALYKALKKEQIAGAGLDVFTEEPPAADDPLLQLDNVVLTPHMGTGSEEAMQRLATEVVRNVVTFLDGGIPESMVNRV